MTTLQEILEDHTMGCIKTGAVIHFPQYNCTMNGDIFRCEDAIYIRANPHSKRFRYGVEPIPVDCHVVSGIATGYWNFDQGVFLVPITCLTTD